MALPPELRWASSSAIWRTTISAQTEAQGQEPLSASMIEEVNQALYVMDLWTAHLAPFVPSDGKIAVELIVGVAAGATSLLISTLAVNGGAGANLIVTSGAATSITSTTSTTITGATTTITATGAVTVDAATTLTLNSDTGAVDVAFNGGGGILTVAGDTRTGGECRGNTVTAAVSFSYLSALSWTIECGMPMGGFFRVDNNADPDITIDADYGVNLSWGGVTTNTFRAPLRPSGQSSIGTITRLRARLSSSDAMSTITVRIVGLTVVGTTPTEVVYASVTTSGVVDYSTEQDSGVLAAVPSTSRLYVEVIANFGAASTVGCQTITVTHETDSV